MASRSRAKALLRTLSVWLVASSLMPSCFAFRRLGDTLAEARPELVALHELSLRALEALDVLESARYLDASAGARSSVLATSDSATAPCLAGAGPEKLALYDEAMRRWAIENGYLERLDRLERGSRALEELGRLLRARPATLTRDLPNCISVLLEVFTQASEERRGQGLVIPSEVERAVELLSGFGVVGS